MLILYYILYIFFGQTLSNPMIPYKSEQRGLTLMSTQIMSHNECSTAQSTILVYNIFH